MPNIPERGEEIGGYCESCGGCGYIACDGIRTFLEKHVKGKTDCSEEAGFIEEIISYIENQSEE